MANVSFGDAARGNLRALIDTIDREITQLSPSGAGHPATPLRASWTELVKQLALGPEPATRECPTCHSVGMRAASRCGQCWAKLTPLETTAQGVLPHAAPATAPSASDSPRSQP